MCTVTNIKTNRRIGYKALAYKDDKFYSSFTGQEMKIGKVPFPPVIAERLSFSWNNRLDKYPLKSCSFYNSDFAGKTSAFIEKDDAKRLNDSLIDYCAIRSDYRFVLVKIIFDGDVFLGDYHEDPVIISDTIRSIEIIK